MLVRAKVTHLQPPTGRYREAGEEFEHSGPLYKHVEAVNTDPEPVSVAENHETEAPRSGRRRKAQDAGPDAE